MGTAGKKHKNKVNEHNPENLASNESNSLFGIKKSSDKQTAVKAAPVEKKRPRHEVMKEDPVAASLRAAKKQKKTDAKADAQSKRPQSKSIEQKLLRPQKESKPHADEVAASNKLWEKLRSEKTEQAEREKLVNEVLALFSGKILNVLQKHDAARVLQSVFKQGTATQRDALLKEIAGKAHEIARSHYGHFLLISILRNGTAAHKQQLLTELKSHTADLVVHAEGSAVLQLLYSDIASAEQKNEMYRALWGKEITLFEQDDDAALVSLAALFEKDPLCKPRVLRRLEIVLSKAARKGLALTALVQRGGAELLEHGDSNQRTELVGALRDQAVHMMHTRDGARIACGCLRYGDAKDRKALLKALKGYAARAALDPHGALVVCTALECVDDTVLLNKGVLAELVTELPALAMQPHGALPLLQLLAPRSSRHFTPEQLAIMGAVDASASKKDPEARRSELLTYLLPPLLKSCEAHALQLAANTHGSTVLFESVRAGGGAEAAEAAADVSALIAALASAAMRKPPTVEAGAPSGAELVVSHFGAPLFKRLVQHSEAFAEALLKAIKGKLLKWAKQGAGWVVLALLESPQTKQQVRTELKDAGKDLRKCSAAGCRSLSEALSS